MDRPRSPPPPPPPRPAGARKRPRSALVRAAAPGSYPATLTSLAGQTLRVTLSEPADGEVCPLTLCPIAEDALEFLPDATFFATMPHIKRLTLPCGHAFGAMSITYYFARRNMLCPCCRRGHRVPISLECIPAHFRGSLVSHVNAEHVRDLEEQTAADAGVARELLFADGGGVRALLVITFDYIYLSVYYHEADRPVPTFGMQFRLHTDADDPVIDDTGAVQGDPNNPIEFHLPFHERRQLALHASEFPPERISLVAHTRTFGDQPIELARTEPFTLGPREADALHPDAAAFAAGALLVEAGGSQFEVFQLQNPFTANFIHWRIPSSTLVHRMLPSLVIEVD